MAELRNFSRQQKMDLLRDVMPDVLDEGLQQLLNQYQERYNLSEEGFMERIVDNDPTARQHLPGFADWADNLRQRMVAESKHEDRAAAIQGGDVGEQAANLAGAAADLGAGLGRGARQMAVPQERQQDQGQPADEETAREAHALLRADVEEFRQFERRFARENGIRIDDVFHRLLNNSRADRRLDPEFEEWADVLQEHVNELQNERGNPNQGGNQPPAAPAAEGAPAEAPQNVQPGEEDQPPQQPGQEPQQPQEDPMAEGLEEETDTDDDDSLPEDNPWTNNLPVQRGLRWVGGKIAEMFFVPEEELEEQNPDAAIRRQEFEQRIEEMRERLQQQQYEAQAQGGEQVEENQEQGRGAIRRGLDTLWNHTVGRIGNPQEANEVHAAEEANNPAAQFPGNQRDLAEMRMLERRLAADRQEQQNRRESLFEGAHQMSAAADNHIGGFDWMDNIPDTRLRTQMHMSSMPLDGMFNSMEPGTRQYAISASALGNMPFLDAQMAMDPSYIRQKLRDRAETLTKSPFVAKRADFDITPRLPKRMKLYADVGAEDTRMQDQKARTGAEAWQSVFGHGNMWPKQYKQAGAVSASWPQA